MLGDGYFDIVISPDEKEGGVWDVGFQGQFWWKWGLLFNASSNLQMSLFVLGRGWIVPLLMEAYPYAKVFELGPTTLDHLPLLLLADAFERNFPKPFRFRCFWPHDNSFCRWSLRLGLPMSMVFLGFNLFLDCIKLNWS